MSRECWNIALIIIIYQLNMNYGTTSKKTMVKCGCGQPK